MRRRIGKQVGGGAVQRFVEGEKLIRSCYWRSSATLIERPQLRAESGEDQDRAGEERLYMRHPFAGQLQACGFFFSAGFTSHSTSKSHTQADKSRVHQE